MANSLIRPHLAFQSSLSVGLVRSIPAVCDSHMPPSQAFLQPYDVCIIYCTEVVTSGLLNTGNCCLVSLWIRAETNNYFH